MPSAMSLFAGCGGCSLGLNRAGIDVVCAADSNSDACHPYTLNLAGTCYQLDLSVTSPQMLLARAGRASHAVDLIVGGPPCQGFSSAGARDWNDPRSLLLKRFVEIVIAIRPTWFIMENPEHLQHPSFSRRALRRVMDGTPTERRGGAPAGLKRLHADQPALTITSAAPTEFVHPIFDRLLTLRGIVECCRHPNRQCHSTAVHGTSRAAYR
jgi:site-specific DNA-cytosine methylase